MTRPRGELRQALYASALELAQASPLGGTTWRDAAAHAKVGFDAACQTWHNMRHAGDLVDVLQANGQPRTVASEGRPMVLCRPAIAASGSGAEALVEARRTWATFR